MSLRYCFTATDIQLAFLKSAQFNFHPTVPGQLLARHDIKKIGYSADGKALYDGEHWKQTWFEMYHLGKKRVQYATESEPYTEPLFIEPDMCPTYDTAQILKKKPFIDYRKVDK